MRIIAGIFSNRLSQLSFDAVVMQFNGDKKVRKLRLVKWATLEYHPDQYRLQVDSLTLPRGRGITEDAMSQPEVVRSLGMSIQKPVAAHMQDGVGLWFLIDREHGMGNIPRFCDFSTVRDHAKQIGPIRIPIGFTGGRKVAMLDFWDEITAHLLIGGAPGGGKSSLLHLIICHLIQQPPELVKLALFDFKRVEFRSYYAAVPHLLHEVVVDPEKFAACIRDIRKEVDRRYSIMADAHVEHIKDYNAHRALANRLPDIFVIVDELASIFLNPMITSRDKEEVDAHLGDIAMRARACGVHLILATQRPDKNVLTGYIRACMSSKIAFACASIDESRIILGTGHAAFKDQVPLGRAIMVRGRYEIPIQVAWISKPQRRAIAAAVGQLPAKEVEAAPPKFRGMEISIQELARYALDNLGGVFDQRKLYQAFSEQGASDYGIRNTYKYYLNSEFELDGKRYTIKSFGKRRPSKIVEVESSRESVVGSELDQNDMVLPTTDCQEDAEYQEWSRRVLGEVEDG